MKELPEKLLHFTHGLTKNLKTEWVIFASDLLASLLCLYLSLRLLLGRDIQSLQMSFILKHCLVFALISFSLFTWLRNEQGKLKYISVEKIPGIMGFAVLANLLFHPLMLLMGGLPPLTPILNTFLFMALLLLPRLLALYWKKAEAKPTSSEVSLKIPVLVVGYNEQIASYLRANHSNQGDRRSFPYQLEGILLNHSLSPDDPVPPFPVLGMIHDFVNTIQKLSQNGREPKRLLITQDSLNFVPLRQILLKLQGRGISSFLFEVSPANLEVSLRPLTIDDLIGKASLDNPGTSPKVSHEISPTNPLEANWQQVQALIDSSRVLITGVHDPVIAQIAQHVAGFYPKIIILVDPSEFALSALRVKFSQLYPDVHCEYVLASITDRVTMDRLIKTHHPQIIIHGDRVTDPELVASNLLMTVQKNIMSPLHFAQDIQKTETCLFVLINPQTPTRLTQIVGRLISQQLQGLDQSSSKSNPTRFLVINSCDVWSNLDSITAFWSDQLKQGLKITLPSPDSYSYLMSAEESARTILQAIVKALINEKTKGEILNLTGGEPTRYLELIRSLSLIIGLVPEVDVKIEFSGKVVPFSFFDEANLLQPLLPGITIGVTNAPSHPEDDYILSKLTSLLEKGQTAKIVALLEKIIIDEGEKETNNHYKLAG